MQQGKFDNQSDHRQTACIVALGLYGAFAPKESALIDTTFSRKAVGSASTSNAGATGITCITRALIAEIKMEVEAGR